MAYLQARHYAAFLACVFWTSYFDHRVNGHIRLRRSMRHKAEEKIIYGMLT